MKRFLTALIIAFCLITTPAFASHFIGTARINDIGKAGNVGFGVGICPPQLVPNGFTPMSGYDNPMSDNYGNYQYKDGSVCVYIPRFYYKITAGTNTIIIASIWDYPTMAAANAAGYAMHRAFIDGGVHQMGFFVDKYENSKNAYGTGYIASSIKNGLPLSTASTHNPIYSATPGVGLTACAGNYYYETINAAHARDGVNGAINASSIWHVHSRFQWSALAMLSLAHGQAATSTAWNAWYHATYNYPLGLNNNNLSNADVDVAGLVYTSDGYVSGNSAKTGSGVPFNKTTHNGQACGVADMNGNMYEINIGMTCIASTMAVTGASQANPCAITVASTTALTTGDWIQITSVVGMTQLNDKVYKITVLDGTTFHLDGIDSTGYTAWSSAGTIMYGKWYAANESTAMKTFTPGNSGATDHWGATGVAALMTKMTMSAMPFKPGGVFLQRYGSSTNQVLDEATSGDGWILTGLGLPRDANAINTTGTDRFGKDFFYQYVRNELCVRSGGYWYDGSNTGLWLVSWHAHRTHSHGHVSLRCALYPE